MQNDGFGGGISDVVPIGAAAFRGLISTIFDQLGYVDTKISDNTLSATAWKTSSVPDAYFSNQKRSQAQIRWQPSPRSAAEIMIVSSVFDDADTSRTLSEEKSRALAQTARAVVESYMRQEPTRSREAPPHDPLVKPGEQFASPFTGTLRDYSGCATDKDIGGLTAGILPLGVYWFGFEDRPKGAGTPLYMSKFSNGGAMEYNGTLICAPQNSGKTLLIVRWAHAAASASKKPYGVFIVDVKGNLRDKLAGKLAGDVYCFSTDPLDDTSDCINFLEGPTGLNAIDTDRIGQLATALLPSRGYAGKGGDDEYHYRNQVVWLTAFIHILKLAQYYNPGWFTDDAGKPRSVDLADLYDLLSDEGRLFEYFTKLLAKEKELEAGPLKTLPPHRGVAYWFSELAIMLDPNKFSIGQRVEKDSFRSYTIALMTALEPFARYGTLYKRTSAAVTGSGRMFDLETVLSDRQKPVTVIIAARQQDLQKSEAVLAMVIKRMQWFLFNRMSQDDAEERPLLLLLDETRRIRDFDAAEYVTFAREAKAGCVIVYQSLDQIGPREKITELLENVGTQIYLGSLVGNTARYFIEILPKRLRPVVSRQIILSVNAETTNTTIGHEQVEYLSTTDLYRLPGGHFPALIHINDLPRRKPFFVDMTEEAE
ncbi:MAG TPA: type IV secretory system conjugative DNA transfer family protein [Xanthobacteraceae bacterium]|jgi:hypothetical protein|nr:type IV secretory system conjugative DNA transfer family protein [Xanthobacteraceae bacterium]